MAERDRRDVTADVLGYLSSLRRRQLPPSTQSMQNGFPSTIIA